MTRRFKPYYCVLWLCAPLMSGCADEAVDVGGDIGDNGITLNFVDALDDSADPAQLAFQDAGRIRVRVRMTMELFDGRPTAQAFLVSDCGSDAEAKTEGDVAMARQRDLESGADMDVWEGETILNCPAGGEISVGARSLGYSAVRRVVIPEPTLSTSAVTSVREGANVRSVVCMDTNVRRGEVEARLIDATTSAGGSATTTTIAIRTGSCSSPEDAASGYRAEFVAHSTGAAFLYSATIDKTDVTISHEVRTTSATEGLVVAFEFPEGSAAERNELAPAGSVVPFTVTTTMGGIAAPNEVVTVGGLPGPIMVAPTEFRTGADGRATGFFEAPSAGTLLLHATASSSVSTALLVRPPTQQLEVSLRFDAGSPGTLGETGTLETVEIVTTRGGAPVGGVQVIVTTVPANAASPATLTTGPNGVASTIIIAPAASSLVIRAQSDGVSDTAILRRDAPLPPSIEIVFPTGSDAAAGELTVAGAVVVSSAVVTRGGEPAAGEVVTLSSAPTLNFVGPTTTDSAGVANFFFVSPDSPAVVLGASLGTASSTRTLVRP
jgi:hypothetical protein